MKLLIINSTNYVANSNNTFTYTFPHNPRFKDEQIAVSSLSMYNSIFNIEAIRGNNTFRIVLNFATPVNLDIVFPDGFYSVEDMQFYIEQKMIENGYYCVDSTGKNEYFFHLYTNSVYYNINAVCEAIPTSAQASAKSWTQGVGATWTYPVTAKTSQFTTFSNTWGDLIGYLASTTLPATPQTTIQTFSSTNTPNIQPINSLILRCNLLNSQHSIPNDILFTQPINTAFGNMIQSGNHPYIWHDIASNSYSNITITFNDQLFNPVILKDSAITLTIAIRNKNEH